MCRISKITLPGRALDVWTAPPPPRAAVTRRDARVCGATGRRHLRLVCVCVSGVTDMSELFYRLYNFNADISGWDTSSVTDMTRMFFVRCSFRAPHRVPCLRPTHTVPTPCPSPTPRCILHNTVSNDGYWVK